MDVINRRRNRTPGHHRVSDAPEALLDQQAEVIEQLVAACREALNALTSCWPSDGFQHGLRQSAREIEDAIRSAKELTARYEAQPEPTN